jgi:hypothetical protein
MQTQDIGLLLLLLLLQGPQGCGACQCQPAVKGVTRSTPAGEHGTALLTCWLIFFIKSSI